MSAKGQQTQKPTLAGIGYLDFSTSQTDVPHTYFAGTRNLPVAWIMNPIITKIVNSSNGKGK